jgi:AbrB family looped-hinge helix DNA binding protein
MSEFVRTRLVHGGRIVIPKEMRERLGVEIGDQLNLKTRGDSLTATSSRAALRRLQDRLKKHISPGVSLADELIAERHEEARSE